MTVSKSTVSNYKAKVASQKNVSICNTVVSKTRTRYTAENSLISAMALLCVVAASHYFICDEDQLQIERDMSTAPEGVRFLYKKVSQHHNYLPIFAVRPELLFSTDDTVNYIYEGKGKGKDQFSLVASKALKKLEPVLNIM